MTEFLKIAVEGSKKLNNDFNETIENCKKLATGMGEKLTDKYTLCNFWETLDIIKEHWNEAQSSLQKIEDLKAKAKAKAEAKAKKKAAKSKVKEKLKRRPSKDVLKEKGVYKSKEDIKVQKEKKEKIGELALQNIIDKQVKEERKLNNKTGGSRMTRHKSLYLAQTRYKCAHCEIIIQDVANLAGDSHCHQCYATPYDKETHNLSLQWLSLNVRNSKCQFKHHGPCLTIYTGQDKKRDQLKRMSSHDKKKMLITSRKHGTTDDLSANSSLSNLRDVNYDDMIYGNGLIDGADLINNLDPKHEKQVMQKMHASWKKELAFNNNNNNNNINNNKIEKNSIILEDKTFWDEILSSDSSETEDDMALNSIIYADKMQQNGKKSRKNKSNAARRAYNKQKRSRHNKQNDSSMDLNKKYGNDFGSKLFTPNPKKSRGGKSRSKRVSFKAPETSQDKITSINFRKKKDSVFMDQDDINGLNQNNTIHRDKLPSRGARKSQFGMKDKPFLQRKSSTYNDNAYGETFKINIDQLNKIKNGGLWPSIQESIEDYGVASIDKETPAIKLVLSEANTRNKAVKAIEKYLGPITDNNNNVNNNNNNNNNDSGSLQTEKKHNISIEKPSQELIFPLTENQIRQATNPLHLKMLMDDLSHFGTIGVDEGLLKLKIPIDLATITPIHKLEKRLGVLMTVDEIKAIRQSIRGDDKINVEQNINPNDIDILKLNDVDFVNIMMKECEEGVEFIKHKKHGVYDKRCVLIHQDRLYWKENKQAKTSRSRSMHLTKIIQVMIGKNTKALKHEDLNNIPSICCFSVVAKKATLDLSSPDKNPIDVRKFQSYLKGLQRHFISQQSQYMAQTPHDRHHKSRHHHNHNHHHSSKHNHSSNNQSSHKTHTTQSKQQQHHQQQQQQTNKKIKLSPIGQGFTGFKFDENTVDTMANDKP